MKERSLVSIRRRVPPGRRPEYDALWARLHAAATARGAHAWRFVAATREELYIEFLEFAAGSDPREEADTAAAMRELAAAFGDPPPPADPIEEWREPRHG